MLTTPARAHEVHTQIDWFCDVSELPLNGMRAAIAQKKLKCTPTIEELLHQQQIHCTEPDCSSVFKNKSNYRFHLERHHRKPQNQNTRNVSFVYHCPVFRCNFHEGNKSARCFPTMKQLRQHYQQVHMEKNYICNNCLKAFITQYALDLHQASGTCGIVYKCSVCGYSYGSLSALNIHSKRKAHVQATANAEPKQNKPATVTALTGNLDTQAVTAATLNDVCMQPVQIEGENDKIQISPIEQVNSNRSSLITYEVSEAPSVQYSMIIHDEYPTNAMAQIVVNTTATHDHTYVERATQTTEETTNPIYIAHTYEEKETQTFKHEQNVYAATQTIPLKAALKCTYDEKQTQTPGEEVDAISPLAASAYDASENPDYNTKWLSSMAAQDVINDDANSNINQEKETQTRNQATNWIVNGVNDDGDDSIIEALWRHIQTQTEQYNEYPNATNMYTQTCKDLLSELDLSDIETQTNWTYSEQTANLDATHSTQTPSNVPISTTVTDQHNLVNNQTQTQIPNTIEKTLDDYQMNEIFGLTDIETQTNWSYCEPKRTWPFLHVNDVWVSTETQTSFDQCLFDTDLNLMDIETQTNWSYFNNLPDTAKISTKNVSMTQPATASENAQADIEAHALSTLLPCDDFLVSTETQTSYTQCLMDTNLDVSAASSCDELYNTQCTQTCDTLLNELLFGDAQDNYQSAYTQT